jgi:hypothetical protein
MEAFAIISELAGSKGLPRAALRAASAQREEMAPIFIAEMERYIAADPDDRIRPDALFFMFHLLAEWREASAYPVMARFLRLPTEEMDRVLDDAITVTSHRVMASVFDGDPQPLFHIILDEHANEFIRSRMCETLAMLVAQGRLGRTVASAFFKDCFKNLRPQANCFVWAGWQNAIAMLGLEELAPLVKEAFRREYIEPTHCDYDWFLDDLQRSMEAPADYWWEGDEDHQLFGDTIEEFSKWHGFTEAYRQDLDRSRQAARDRFVQDYRAHSREEPCEREESFAMAGGRKLLQ